MTHPSPSFWKLPSLPSPLPLLFLSLVPVAAGVLRLLGLAAGGAFTPENARFLAHPAPVAMHIVAATLFCVLGAFQLDASLRRRQPRLHRLAGRVAALCGLLAALTGMWMAYGYPIPAEQQGALLYAARMAVGIAMALSILLSVQAVLQGRLAQHKAWMVRAYALGQGAGTQALILLPVALLAGAPTFVLRDVLMVSAWVLNGLIAEWLIRRPPPLHSPNFTKRFL